MSRVVYIGDMHCVVSEIEECTRLIDGIVAFAKEQEADRIVFLGDQCNNMSHVRLEVLHFLRQSFSKFMSPGAPNHVLALVGNHDWSNDRKSHAMMAFPEIYAIDRPVVWENILHVPYMFDNNEFVKVCKEYPTKTVVCHASFQTAQYENGYYIGAEGVDMNLIPQELVISGHIHKPGKYGRVWYIGAPRWRSASDANEQRAVWMVEHDKDGRVVRNGLTPMDTAPFCKQILQFEFTPERMEVVPPASPLHDVRVNVKGPTEFVNKWSEKFRARGVQVKIFRTDAASISVREDEGLEAAWMRYINALKPERGTSPERVRELAKEYGI